MDIIYKRYQELGIPYKIIRWLRYMPVAYIKAIWWYFVKRLRWEDVCNDKESGRISWNTCLGLNAGSAHHKMGWYYTMQEVFGELGILIEEDNRTNDVTM